MPKQSKRRIPISKAPVHLSSNHELFMAVCYRRPTRHSFIIVGAHDNTNNRNYLLSAVGKYADFEIYKPACGIFDVLWSDVPCKLKEENFLYRLDSSYDVSYKAYSLSPEQYRNYLETINACTRDYEFGSYELDQKSANNNTVTYAYTPAQVKFNNPEPAINQSIKKISLFNTCRHTAKEIIKTTLGSLDKSISSLFLITLPFRTTITAATIANPLFIFPTPPDEKQNGQAYFLLSRIYKQMEACAHRHQRNQTTYEKFQSLKAIYVELDQRKNSDSVLDLFNLIDSWESNNKMLIDKQRSFSFFRHTATRRMVDEIHNYRSALKLGA